MDSSSPLTLTVMDSSTVSKHSSLLLSASFSSRWSSETERMDDAILVYVDVDEYDGVEFMHSVASNVTVAEIADDEVKSFTRSFFPLNGAVSYDGHFLPLFAVQVTQLADGIFLGCSFNHAVGDGNSFMNLLTTWAQICQNESHKIHAKGNDYCSIEEIIKLPIKLPFKNPSEFFDRLTIPPQLEIQERMFHLSSQSVTKLKSKANNELNTDKEISSLQSLCSLIWRSVTRARRLSPEQKTSCRLAANNRPRLRPPLPDEFFGCTAVLINSTMTVGELMGHGLGWGSMPVHRNVVAHTDAEICSAVSKWVEALGVYQPSMFDRHSITIGGSQRFDLYGCDFGWGRAMAVRSGVASKYDGKVALYMGREEKGSVDLEINLAPEDWLQLSLMRSS